MRPLYIPLDETLKCRLLSFIKQKIKPVGFGLSLHKLSALRVNNVDVKFITMKEQKLKANRV